MRNQNDTQRFSGDISIVGPRPSGKLTFLVALACFRDRSHSTPILSVETIGQDLIEMGRDILQMGRMLSPMCDPVSVSLSITFEPKSNTLTLFDRQIDRKLVKLNTYCTTYPGEYFAILFNNSYSRRELLDKLETAERVVFLFDSTSSGRDADYARAISVLRERLSNQVNSLEVNKKYAIVFSKMDVLPGFFYLPDLDDFIDIKFPKLFSEFQQWSRDENCAIRYFGCSAFGMVGHPPKPNAVRVAGARANIDAGCGWVIKEPSAWQPFGLVSPLYWLLTGKDDPRLLDYPLFN